MYCPKPTRSFLRGVLVERNEIFEIWILVLSSFDSVEKGAAEYDFLSLPPQGCFFVLLDLPETLGVLLRTIR